MLMNAYKTMEDVNRTVQIQMGAMFVLVGQATYLTQVVTNAEVGV